MSNKDSDSKGLTRRYDLDDNNNIDENLIKNEVKKLFTDNNGRLDPKAVDRLRGKFRNNPAVVDAIIERFQERYAVVRKVASIFLEKFVDKYGLDMPMHVTLKKMKKYKEKYGLSDDEYDEVKNQFQSKLYRGLDGIRDESLKSQFLNTNMSKLLGHYHMDSLDGMNISNNNDFGVLDQILEIQAAGKMLHSNIIVQTLTYAQDFMLPVQVTGAQFQNNRHNVLSHVHPVIVALFTHRFPELDERMLLASIAGIVHKRSQKLPILTKPDLELMNALVNDPNDVVCGDSSEEVSPMADLADRVRAQHSLWQVVFDLRYGKVFEPSNAALINNIDSCRISNVDSPDLVYVSDEGVILRRLFNIFAFRPIWVITRPIYGFTVAANPFGLPVFVDRLTTLPYITIRLPLDSQIAPGAAPAALAPGLAPPAPPVGLVWNNIDIHTYLESNKVYYLENDMYVPKTTKVFDCNSILIYYVPRRIVRLPFSITFPYTYSVTNINQNLTMRNMNTVSNVSVKFDVEYTMRSEASQSEKHFGLSAAVYFVKDTRNINGNPNPNSAIPLYHQTVLFDPNMALANTMYGGIRGGNYTVGSWRANDLYVKVYEPMETVRSVGRAAANPDVFGNGSRTHTTATGIDPAAIAWGALPSPTHEMLEILKTRGTIFVYRCLDCRR